jgi:hypothetical protein
MGLDERLEALELGAFGAVSRGKNEDEGSARLAKVFQIPSLATRDSSREPDADWQEKK